MNVGHVLECGGSSAAFDFKTGKNLVSGTITLSLISMPESTMAWPHAPTHQLSTNGTYFVTAGTYARAHYFRTHESLAMLERELLAVAKEFSWTLEAWAVFSNHYHFVGHSPHDSDDAKNLSKLLSELHRRTAIWINRFNNTSGRKTWHNFWETQLTYQKSYLARLNYVHQNPVKHGLVPVANHYPWCSAREFERMASPAMVKSIYRFKTDALKIRDDFIPVLDG